MNMLGNVLTKILIVGPDHFFDVFGPPFYFLAAQFYAFYSAFYCTFYCAWPVPFLVPLVFSINFVFLSLISLAAYSAKAFLVSKDRIDQLNCHLISSIFGFPPMKYRQQLFGSLSFAFFFSLLLHLSRFSCLIFSKQQSIEFLKL